jgi:hypothetical protein
MLPPRDMHGGDTLPCARPAERPVAASGHAASREEARLPPCLVCLQLLLEDVRRFWEGMGRKPVFSPGRRHPSCRLGAELGDPPRPRFVDNPCT